MSAVRIGQLLSRALAIVVLATSGWYLIVYLYRWEWNRAIVSGIFFVAAETVLVGMVVVGHLRRLSTRVDELGRRQEEALARRITAENDARGPQSFRWLHDSSSRVGVFIPVLLGAGVILSFVAYVVERVAAVLAGPTADRVTVERLGLDLPLGTTQGRPARVPAAASAWRRGRVIAVGLLVVVLGIALIDDLRDATMSHPEKPAGAATYIDLRIDQRGPTRDVRDVAAALTTACRHRLSGPVDVRTVEVVGPSQVQIVVRPGLGELRRRRYFGCLDDVILERVSSHVISYRASPEATEAVGSSAG
jgi:hypothetical protein